MAAASSSQELSILESLPGHLIALSLLVNDEWALYISASTFEYPNFLLFLGKVFLPNIENILFFVKCFNILCNIEQ